MRLKRERLLLVLNSLCVIGASVGLLFIVFSEPILKRLSIPGDLGRALGVVLLALVAFALDKAIRHVRGR